MTAGRSSEKPLAKLVSFDRAKPFTLAQLASRLGVDARTAQQRVEAFVRQHGYRLKRARGEPAAFFIEDPNITLPPRSRAKGRQLSEERTEVTRPASPHSSVTVHVRGIDALFSSGDDASLGIPQQLDAVLTPDELFPLRVLAREQSARTSELAARLGRPPSRMGGLMRALQRKLHALGFALFTVEQLPSGESMYRFSRRGPHAR